MRLNEDGDASRNAPQEWKVADELDRIAEAVLATDEDVSTLERASVPHEMVRLARKLTACLSLASRSFDAIGLAPSLGKIATPHGFRPAAADISEFARFHACSESAVESALRSNPHAGKSAPSAPERERLDAPEHLAPA